MSIIPIYCRTGETRLEINEGSCVHQLVLPEKFVHLDSNFTGRSLCLSKQYAFLLHYPLFSLFGLFCITQCSINFDVTLSVQNRGSNNC